MGYYIRILGTNDLPISLGELESALRPKCGFAEIRDAEPTEAAVNAFVLAHRDGSEIASIERNPVVKGELGAEELQEFMDEVDEYKPASAASWVQSYLPKVRVIYAFQILYGADQNNGWNAIHSIFDFVHKKVGGVSQADGEGFSNEQGYHILWQFADSADGNWGMAVLDSKGKWIQFEMDLGDAEQRESFLKGEVPKGAKLV